MQNILFLESMNQQQKIILKKNYYCMKMLILFFTIFRVIDGLDTLDELEKLQVNPKNFKPLNDTKLNNVTIHANPFAK